MSMPSRIIASSLARNSTERDPACNRGNLKTPDSRRLYQRMNPSRSHARSFNLSPRRERKTNRPLPKGSWPITVLTRSANRSKPHRISVGSAASQMRHACAPSSVRRLGRPITLLPPIPPAMHVNDPRRIRAPLQDCSREQDESQSPRLAPLLSLEDAASSAEPLALRRTQPFPPLANASSTQTFAMMSYPVHGKMPPRSVRSPVARTPMLAISTTTPRPVRSHLQNDSIP